MENYLGHALVGCASSVAMGGKCGNGALAQVVSKYYSIESNGNFVKTVVAGGIAAEITGGRFADGALTASFGYLFNCLANKCNASDYDSEGKNFHEYGPFASSICDTAQAGCLEAARRQLLCNSAPGQSACAIVGKVIPQGLSGGNPITQYAVNPDMVINGTSPGHVFHDGYVVRWLMVNDAGIAQIWTYGRGTNTSGATAFVNKWGGIGIFKWIGLRNSAEAND